MSQRDSISFRKFDLIKFERTNRIRSFDVRLTFILFILISFPLLKVGYPFWSYFDVGPFEKEDILETVSPDVKFLEEPHLPDKVDLLVMINSQIGETETREAIRKSWGNSANFDPKITSVVFVIGKPKTAKEIKELDKEVEKYKDLLVTDLDDDYYSLALKTYAMVYYKAKRQPDAKCLVKADSDNVLQLFNYELLCEETKAPVILGKCDVDRRVKRRNSKWKVPYNLYEKTRWPKYCSTGTYIFVGRDIPKQILAASLSTRFFSSINYRRLPEDVLFTGLFAEKVGIQRRTIAGISFRDQPMYACRDVKYTLSIHMHRRKDPVYFYKKLLSLEGTMCLI